MEVAFAQISLRRNLGVRLSPREIIVAHMSSQDDIRNSPHMADLPGIEPHSELMGQAIELTYPSLFAIGVIPDLISTDYRK